MLHAIGRRFTLLMPTRDRHARTQEMLAALVACESGHMSPQTIHAAVGVRRLRNGSGFALAKRMGLVAPVAANVPLYKVSPLGETVLRFLDAEA